MLGSFRLTQALFFCVIFGCITVSTCLAQVDGVEYQWEQKRDSDGIAVFTSLVPDSPYKAVWAEMIVKGEVASLVALLNDFPNCARWVDLCRESRPIKWLSDTKLYVYAYNDIPFPVKDRDVVGLMQWSRNADTGRLTMSSVAVGMPESVELEPLNNKAVRLTEAMTQWHFTALADGKTRVENFTHASPSGPIPAWFFNFMVMRSPHKSMKRMRELIEAGGYVDAEEPVIPAASPAIDE